MAGITRTMSDFVAGLGYEEIPVNVRTRTKYMLLDTFGCEIGAVPTKVAKLILSYANLSGGSGICNLPNLPKKVSTLAAAYVHSRLANVLDADEGSSVPSHHTASTYGSALAACEYRDRSGKELLASFAVGYEIGYRIALAMNSRLKGPALSYAMIFAATAAACNALGATSEQVNSAFGLAAKCIPISTHERWNASFPLLPISKYADSGICSQIGLTQAVLAMQGDEGFPDIFDDPYPFWDLYGSKYCDSKALTSGLGKIWHIGLGAYKPWPGARFTHYALTALEKVKLQNDLQLKEIKAISVKFAAGRSASSIWIDQPSNITSAEFSVHHALAMYLLNYPPSSAWYEDSMLKSERVKQLRGRITVIVESEKESFGRSGRMRTRKRNTSIEIDTKKETLNAKVDHARGDQWDPKFAMSESDIIKKFRSFTSYSVSGESDAKKLKVLEDKILNIQRARVKHISKLVASLSF